MTNSYSYQQNQAKKYLHRLTLVEILVYLAFIALLLRALSIQFFSSKSLQKIANTQYSSSIKLGNYRGTIFDRRNHPLALSVKKPSVVINPRVFSPNSSQITKLSSYLSISKKRIVKLSNKKSYFAWLKRHTTQKNAQMIRNLNISGLYVLNEPGRFYPTSHASTHVIGKVDIDNRGLFGIEYQLDDLLSGEAGKIITVRDGRGELILQNYQNVTPEQPGKSVTLTIDSYLQIIASEELEKGVKDAKAKSGFALVGDPFTGAILAMVSYPSYDPNLELSSRVQQSGFSINHTKNTAASDIFEPGSIIKPFVVAEVLRLGLTTMDHVYKFDKSGVYRLERGRITDDHPKQIMTTEQILINSSNIGMYYLAEKITSFGLYDLLKKIGIGKKQAIKGINPIVAGSISKPDNWHPVRFANISFGQGFSVNGLDMLKIYNILASGGRYRPLYMISKITDSYGADISYRALQESTVMFSPQIIKQVSLALNKITTQGTGTLARTKHYSVAGKTGTSEKYDPEIRAYSQDKRIASFAGFAPYSDPKITIVVVIDEPKNKPYYGGKWAAPVFSKITERSLNYLGIVADKFELEEHATDHDKKTKALQAKAKNLKKKSNR